MKNKQLYTFIPDIEFPAIERFDRQTGEVVATTSKREGYFSFVWPNGQSCIPIEMFLLDISDTKKITKSDGGTVGTYACNLSHLVRYCFEKEIEFWDLTSFDIDELSKTLSNEVNEYNESLRNNNTILSIISQVIIFLKWLQIEMIPGSNIVGVDSDFNRYQIKLKVRKNPYKGGRGRKSEYFPSKLPASTTQAKKPMANKNIKLLWDTLITNRPSAGINKRLIKIFSKQEQKEHIDYMYHRRRFQLTMLEATGLRPQELINIPAKGNIKYLNDSKIELPTLKREADEIRVIPIDHPTVIKIELFMNIHRKKLIRRLLKHGLVSDESEIDDVIFLNPETGKKVMPDAAYQEFKRLSNKAGISQQSCQSMLRHRFITNMVKLHLISFMGENPAVSRHIVSASDKRTILKKVATFTGHKDPESLDHYIDLAWDELNVFSYAYGISNLQGKLKSISLYINDIRGDIANSKTLSKSKVLELLESTLNEIENLSDLNNQH